MLFNTSVTLAQQIASYNPVVVKYAKQALSRGAGLPLADGLKMERTLSSLVLRSSRAG
jgi:hypothetical protein